VGSSASSRSTRTSEEPQIRTEEWQADRPARQYLHYSTPQPAAPGLSRSPAHSPRRNPWIVGNGVIGSIGEIEVNNEALVSLSNEDASLDEAVNEREVSDSGIEVVRW
jgi:hypothetical protein